MSDTTLRELERRWRSTRDPADEARVLAERLRLRQLSRARLEMAAFLGHGPAVEVLGDGAPVGDAVPWRRWRQEVDERGRVPLARLVLARLQGTISSEAVARLGLLAPLEAARRWCACPCDEHVAEVAEHAAAVGLPGMEAITPDEFGFHLQLGGLLRAIVDELGEAEDGRDGPMRHLIWALGRSGEHGRRAPETEMHAVVAWVLGDEHAFVPVAEEPSERRYLAERLRRGELTDECVEVAAYAGSEVARDVLLDAGRSVIEPVEELTEWLKGLARWRGWALRAVAQLAGGSLRWPITQGLASRSAVRFAMQEEWRVRRTACGVLTTWAERGDEEGGLEARAGLERLLNDPRLGSLGDGGRAARIVRDVLVCVLDRASVPPEVMVGVVAAADPREVDDVRRAVRSWALRHPGE